MMIIKEKQLLFTQKKPDKQTQVLVNTEETSDVELVLQILECSLTNKPSVMIFSTEEFEMTFESAQERDYAWLNRIGLVN